MATVTFDTKTEKAVFQIITEMQQRFAEVSLGIEHLSTQFDLLKQHPHSCFALSQ